MVNAKNKNGIKFWPFHHDVAKIVKKFSTHGQAQSGVMVLAWLQGGRKVTQVGRSLRSEGHSGWKVAGSSEGWSGRKVGRNNSENKKEIDTIDLSQNSFPIDQPH